MKCITNKLSNNLQVAFTIPTHQNSFTSFSLPYVFFILRYIFTFFEHCFDYFDLLFSWPSLLKRRGVAVCVLCANSLNAKVFDCFITLLFVLLISQLCYIMILSYSSSSLFPVLQSSDKLFVFALNQSRQQTRPTLECLISTMRRSIYFQIVAQARSTTCGSRWGQTGSNPLRYDKQIIIISKFSH